MNETLRLLTTHMSMFQERVNFHLEQAKILQGKVDELASLVEKLKKIKDGDPAPTFDGTNGTKGTNGTDTLAPIIKPCGCGEGCFCMECEPKPGSSAAGNAFQTAVTAPLAGVGMVAKQYPPEKSEFVPVASVAASSPAVVPIAPPPLAPPPKLEKRERGYWISDAMKAKCEAMADGFTAGDVAGALGVTIEDARVCINSWNCKGWLASASHGKWRVVIRRAMDPKLEASKALMRKMVAFGTSFSVSDILKTLTVPYQDANGLLATWKMNGWIATIMPGLYEPTAKAKAL